MFCLAAEQVEPLWEDFSHHFERFERACKDMTAEQVKRAASQGLMQIWGLQDAEGVNGVCATEILETHRGLVCVIRIACGSAPRGLMERLLDEIGRWARASGCIAVRYIGRRGWLRRFPRFTQTGVVAEWELACSR